MFYGSMKFTRIDHMPDRELEGESLWARLERVEAFALPEPCELAHQRVRAFQTPSSERDDGVGEGLLGRVQSFFRRAA